jgi:hypothetical protein
MAFSKPIQGEAKFALTCKDKTVWISQYTSIIFHPHWFQINYKHKTWWIPVADVLDLHEYGKYPHFDESTEKS